MNIASKVGSRIRILREAAGLTQSELAATAYITRQSVGNWERGNTLPDVQSLQLVAKALNTTVDGLLGDELPDMLEETAEARRQLTRCLAALGAILHLSSYWLSCIPLFCVRLEAESSVWCSAG